MKELFLRSLKWLMLLLAALIIDKVLCNVFQWMLDDNIAPWKYIERPDKMFYLIMMFSSISCLFLVMFRYFVTSIFRLHQACNGNLGEIVEELRDSAKGSKKENRAAKKLVRLLGQVYRRVYEYEEDRGEIDNLINRLSSGNFESFRLFTEEFEKKTFSDKDEITDEYKEEITKILTNNCFVDLIGNYIINPFRPSEDFSRNPKIVNAITKRHTVSLVVFLAPAFMGTYLAALNLGNPAYFFFWLLILPIFDMVFWLVHVIPPLLIHARRKRKITISVRKSLEKDDEEEWLKKAQLYRIEMHSLHSIVEPFMGQDGPWYLLWDVADLFSLGIFFIFHFWLGWFNAFWNFAQQQLKMSNECSVALMTFIFVALISICQIKKDWKFYEWYLLFLMRA